MSGNMRPPRPGATSPVRRLLLADQVAPIDAWMVRPDPVVPISDLVDDLVARLRTDNILSAVDVRPPPPRDHRAEVTIVAAVVDGWPRDIELADLEREHFADPVLGAAYAYARAGVTDLVAMAEALPTE